MGWIQRAIEMEDHTNAICPNCLNPLESWKVIDAGICPKCNARITAEDIRDGWCEEALERWPQYKEDILKAIEACHVR
jgi:predicted amidophosphoribosyltransferase